MGAIISRPGDGERFVRENRTVMIRLDLPELSIHEIEFDTTFAVPRHTHSHVDAMYVLDGEVEFLDGDDIARVGAGATRSSHPGLDVHLRPVFGRGTGSTVQNPDIGV
jgi:quercetin dioxygenase-like cupin family protein